MRGRVALVAVLALLLVALAGCGSVNKLLGRTPTTTLSSVRVAAPPGANLYLSIILRTDAGTLTFHRHGA